MCRFILTLLVLAGLSLPGAAQIYKYTDKEGVVRYTDDISTVPADKQSTAVRNAEPESEPTDPAPPIAPKVDPVPPPPSKESAGPEKGPSEQAQALDKEFKELMAEKDRIDKEIAVYSKRYKTRSRKGVSRKMLQELEIQKAEWEKKFQDYQVRKKALETKIRNPNIEIRNRFN